MQKKIYLIIVASIYTLFLCLFMTACIHSVKSGHLDLRIPGAPFSIKRTKDSIELSYLGDVGKTEVYWRRDSDGEFHVGIGETGEKIGIFTTGISPLGNGLDGFLDDVVMSIQFSNLFSPGTESCRIFEKAGRAFEDNEDLIRRVLD